MRRHGDDAGWAQARLKPQPTRLHFLIRGYGCRTGTQEVLQSHVLTHAACLGCDALPGAFRAGECKLRGSCTIVPIFSVFKIAFQ